MVPLLRRHLRRRMEGPMRQRAAMKESRVTILLPGFVRDTHGRRARHRPQGVFQFGRADGRRSEADGGAKAVEDCHCARKRVEPPAVPGMSSPVAVFGDCRGGGTIQERSRFFSCFMQPFE